MLEDKIEQQKELIYKTLSYSRSLVIILDACRYDAFTNFIQYLKPLKVNVKKVRSSGSCTQEWLLNTFSDPIDAVYITANPMVLTVLGKKNIFKKIIDVSAKFWNKELNTVKAEYVNLVATKYIIQGERLIVHYIQPHAPFVTSNKWLRGKSGTIYKHATYNPIVRYYFKKGYVDNLMYVLSNAKKLIIKAMKNNYRKIVITADHGELLGAKLSYDKLLKSKSIYRVFIKIFLHTFGIYRLVDHPCGWDSDELRIVPWAEIIIS